MCRSICHFVHVTIFCPPDCPTCPQVRAISRDWASRAGLPQHVVQMVNSFPSNLHPMAQFSAAITAMHSESKFAKGYSEGIHKTKYWEVRKLEVGEEMEVSIRC